MNKLEWLTSLDPSKRNFAMLVIAVMVLFGMWMRSEYNRNVEKERHENVEAQYREVLISRTDAFNEVTKQLLIDCNEKVEKVLREQLQKSENTLVKTNKIVEKNENLIKKVKVP